MRTRGRKRGEAVGLTRERGGKRYRKKTIMKYVEGLRAARFHSLFVHFVTFCFCLLSVQHRCGTSRKNAQKHKKPCSKSHIYTLYKHADGSLVSFLLHVLFFVLSPFCLQPCCRNVSAFREQKQPPHFTVIHTFLLVYILQSYSTGLLSLSPVRTFTCSLKNKIIVFVQLKLDF